MKNQFLTGKQIYLSALAKEDITADYISWLNDKDVCRENSHATFPNTSEKTMAYVEAVSKTNSEVVLAIKWKKNNEHIGNISLQRINWVSRSAELAIIIGNKKYWNKGVGTEAYRLMIDYAFDRLNLNRISSGQTLRNKGMINVCIKCGMKEEGIARESMFKEGEYIDTVTYSILSKEREKQKLKTKKA
jgi:RimJ/RimL family protein N-acetyltransferase